MLDREPSINRKRRMPVLLLTAALSAAALNACDYNYSGPAATLSPEEKAAKEQKAQELDALSLRGSGVLDLIYDDEVPFGDKAQAFYTALDEYLNKAEENGIPTHSEYNNLGVSFSSCKIERIDDDGLIAVNASSTWGNDRDSASIFFHPKGNISYMVYLGGSDGYVDGVVNEDNIGSLGFEVSSLQETFTNPDSPCLLEGDFLVRVLVGDQQPSSGGGGGAGSSAS